MVKFFEGLPLFPSRSLLTPRLLALEYCAPAHASPQTRSIVAALTAQSSPGPTLDADRIKMLDLLIPRDLTDGEVAQIIDSLRGQGPKASSPEAVFVAIERAVRGVRNKGQTLRVNGIGVAPDGKASGAQDAGSSARGDGGEEGPITSFHLVYYVGQGADLNRRTALAGT